MPVQEFISVDQFHKDVTINPADIQTAYIEQAGHYAYYAGLFFKAQRQTGNYKIVRDTLAAKIDQEIRQASVVESMKVLADDPKAKVEKLTEAGVISKRDSDPRYTKAVKDYLDAQAIEKFIGNALNAFEQRRDMLISLGSTIREEMKGELRIRASTESTGALKDAAGRAYDRLTNGNTV